MPPMIESIVTFFFYCKVLNVSTGSLLVVIKNGKYLVQLKGAMFLKFILQESLKSNNVLTSLSIQESKSNSFTIAMEALDNSGD